ncbi:flagella basal body P-ring formation protein FlgA [Psychromonas sp. Urea-02u-13]|nr:flagella basal body P-ring formation protein FlgA [Psychromonas sp. Urea-02u-13]
MLMPCFCSAIEPADIIDIVAKQVEKDTASFSKRMQWKHYRYTSKLRHPLSVTNLSKCSVDLAVKSSNNDIINNVRYKVTCSKAVSHQKWSINVNTKINYFMGVATLSNSVNKGHLIKASDIVYVEKKIRKNNEYLFSDNNVIGEKTKRKLKRGSLLKRKDIKVNRLVLREREVLIVIKHEHLNMATTGIPLKSGELGDTIKVKNKRSGNIITAIVIGRDKVAVKVY